MSGKKETLRDKRRSRVMLLDLRAGLPREARMCSTKYRYESKEVAQQFAEHYFRVPMRTYHCPYGDHWHLTKSL